MLQAVVGDWGAVFLSFGLLISVLGAYLSWSLLAAEVLYTAAESETMPKFLRKENKNKVPSAALWMTNITVQIFLMLTVFAEEAFTLAKELTGSMNLIPYLLVAAYGLKLSSSGETYGAKDAKQRRFDLFCGTVATIFCDMVVVCGWFEVIALVGNSLRPGYDLVYYYASWARQADFYTAGVGTLRRRYGRCRCCHPRFGYWRYRHLKQES